MALKLTLVSLFLLGATLASAKDLVASEPESYSSSYSHVPQFESGGYGQGEKYDAKEYVKKEFGDYAKDFFGGSSQFGNEGFLKQGQQRDDLKKQFSEFGDYSDFAKDFHEKGLFTRHRGIGYEKAWGWDKTKEVKDSGDKKQVHGASKKENSELKKEERKDFAKYGKQAHGDDKYQSAKGQKSFGQLRKESESGGKSYENDFKFRSEPIKYSQQRDGYQHSQGRVVAQNPGYGNPEQSGFQFETGFGDKASLGVQGPSQSGYNGQSQSIGGYGTRTSHGDQAQTQGTFGGHNNQGGYGSDAGYESQGQIQVASEGQGSYGNQAGDNQGSYGNQAGDNQGSYGNQAGDNQGSYGNQAGDNQGSYGNQAGDNQGSYGNQAGDNQGSYGNQAGDNQGSYGNQGSYLIQNKGALRDQNQGGYRNEGQNHGGYSSENQNQGGYGNEGHKQGSYHNEGQNQGGYRNVGQNKGNYKNQGQIQGDLHQEERFEEVFGKRIRKEEPNKLQGRFRGRKQQRGRNQVEEVGESREGVLYEKKPLGVQDKDASDYRSIAGEYDWIVKRNPSGFFQTGAHIEPYGNSYGSSKGSGQDYASKLKYKRVSAPLGKEASGTQISRRADDEEVENRRRKPIMRLYGGNRRFSTRYSSGLKGFGDSITKRNDHSGNRERKWSFPSSGNTVLRGS